MPTALAAGNEQSVRDARAGGGDGGSAGRVHAIAERVRSGGDFGGDGHIGVSGDGVEPGEGGGRIGDFCTGLGAVKPAVVNGAAAPKSPPLAESATVMATVGGKAAQVGYAGGAGVRGAVPGERDGTGRCDGGERAGSDHGGGSGECDGDGGDQMSGCARIRAPRLAIRGVAGFRSFCDLRVQVR